MKTYIKGATISFIFYSVTLFLLSMPLSEDNGFMSFILVYAFPIIYAVCFASEVLIILLEWKWYGRTLDWLIITPAALIVSAPFWGFPPLYVPILAGACGFFIGRRLPDRPIVFGLIPLPLVIILFIFAIN